MEVFANFLSEYAPTLLTTVLTALFGYVGMTVRNLYKKYVTDVTAQNVVHTAVSAVEQLYKDLGGEEKLQKALTASSEMLLEKGVRISELELRMLIEASVAEFKSKLSSPAPTSLE